MKRLGALNLARNAHNQIFKRIHSNHLIYNACWEDPRIDRELLKLDGNSRVVMITSAGCNALDYALDSPVEIHAVDVNPRQNALLQLKLKLIEQGSFADLFAVCSVLALIRISRRCTTPASKGICRPMPGNFGRPTCTTLAPPV